MSSKDGYDELIKKLRKTGEKVAKQFQPIASALPRPSISEDMLNQIKKATQMNEQTAKMIRDINKQFDSFRATLAKLEQEAPDYMQEKFDYIEEYGLPNGFAYTAYMSADDQIEMIEKYLEGNLTGTATKDHIEDMRNDFEYRLLDRLEYGKKLAEAHVENIFNGNPMLSIHYLVIIMEEILKSYNGFPSSNKLGSPKSRKDIKEISSTLRDEMVGKINSPFHSVELVKKSYDEVLIKEFYRHIKKENPAELPFINRNDVVHIYSDTDRFSYIDVYKTLLLISSVLDLLEIMDIVKMEENESDEVGV